MSWVVGLSFDLRLIALAFAAWSWGLATTQSPIDRRWGVAAIIAAILAGAAVAALGESAAPASRGAEQAGAEPFNAAKLTELRAQGRPVLVNFTAAWCITCLLNERVALSRPEVVAAIKANGVVYLKADWTNRNAEITAALHEMDRDGVPVYALYLPGKPPRLLPQVLTPGLVIAVLNGR